jgi:hypothetical protein
MSYSDSSQLLNKQAELKTLQARYDAYNNSYTSIASTSSTPIPNNKNAISSTNPPSGIRAGEDFGEYWKFVSSGATDAAACWSSASRDPRVFQKVVYTGANDDTSTATNNGDATWNNKCYGLVWNAPAEASYTTNAPGYSTMVSNVGNIGGKGVYYTKSGITSTDSLNEATQIADLKSRIDALIEEIAVIAGSSINSELSALSQTSGDQKTVIQKINQYMNSSAQQIDASNNIINQRKNMNNVYEDINKQITLNSRKYKFVFYFLIGVVIIITYISYVSKLTLMEQFAELTNWVTWGWWTNWGVITFVVVLLILSSFGWDMKGNILMIIRYISDPDFWTGQMWWVGVSFLFLIIIFLHASFKSFFGDSLAQLEKMGEEDE